MTSLPHESAVRAAPAARVHLVRRLVKLAGPYWNSPRKVRARAATLLLMLLTGAQVGLSVWGNYWNRALFDAIEQRSVRGVLVQVAVFALIFVVGIAVTAAHLMVKRWLQLDWRAWLTDRLIGRWMEDGRHYRLLFNKGEHDNPDQRIAEDIRIATESAITMLHSLTFALITLGSFVGILWSVSGTITMPGTHIQVPGYLVPLAFLYAGAGTLLSWMLGRPLVRSTNALQTAEANFRFGLSRAREHSESIALMHGESIERIGAAARFKQIMRDFDRQSLAYLGLVSFWNAYGGLLPVFPLLVAAPQYIMGAMTLGALMQAVQAFQQLTSALSWPVNNIAEIAHCRTSAERVLSLYEDLERLDAQVRAPGEHRITLERGEDRRLTIDDLCIAEPSGLVVVEHFDAVINRGERVLLTGDPTLTSSLFKVIGGLWPWGSGRVLLPKDGDFLFMPQRPFLPEGTLREALCYPRARDAFDSDAMRHALECVGAEWLVTRLDQTDNWEQNLPQQAQQRLGLARVLLQRPAWIFMEEATDAFDPKHERLLLEMLERELPDTALLTISFHPGLEALHHRKIVLTRPTETKKLFDGGAAGAPH
jgi:vitamin B12/bleomycin/antimicrobial peptide transport system ATP-binding/permease protein